MTEKNRNTRHILIVEYDPDIRAELVAALEGEYSVACANAEADAFSAVNTASLVLLDVSTGLLRRMLEYPVPIIAMSADRADEANALYAGAANFLRLPCAHPETVRAHVYHAFETVFRSSGNDPLTGLNRRETFFKRIRQFDAQNPERDMDAIVINICYFHMINERYGRAHGDDVLRHIARQIQAFADANGGLACRRHSDVFFVYCPHDSNYSGILKNDMGVRLRMGVYPSVDKSLDVERRFDYAKVASDTIRNSFTRSVAIYDAKLRNNETRVEQLLEDFPTAIAEKQFTVYYQPKFAIQATMPVLNGAEALVRWIHPKLGMISPVDFIPLFESNGLIRDLDRYVWRMVAAQMRDWKDRLHFCLPVSVNVSRIDMFDDDLVDYIQNLVREFDLSPDEFLLEITESAYTQDTSQIIETVNRLRSAGFHIEIDDFGTGYSSLNMISTLPIDALKLDMEFMRNAFKERKNTKMLDAVIDIAYSLEVPTIAEGVETAEQMFALKEMGCDVVQGYYFSRPLPPEKYELFLVERKRALIGQFAERDAAIKPPEQFAYEALHDPLTGLYNHSAYKILLQDADQRNIALLLADVVNYKTVPKETAEKMIVLVADVLRHSFRSVDFVCRIGEDEFAVIITRVNSAMKALIADKVARINGMLAEHGEDLPAVELHIGVAFADRENPQGDIFHDADTALSREDGEWAVY